MLLFLCTSGFTRVGVRWLVARCFRPFSSVLLATRQISASYRIMGLGPPVMGGGLVAFCCCLPSSGPPEIFTWHLLPIPPPPLPFHVRFPPHTMALPMCCGPGAHLPHTALLIMLI